MDASTTPFRLPLIAILRGITPDAVSAHVRALVEDGFDAIEIPTNSPDWQQSVAIAAREFRVDAHIGAGTVLGLAHVDALLGAGGTLVVTPNTNPVVIRHAVERGLLVAAGCATATEAFAALEAGASVLKLVPAEVIGPAGLKAMASVLPAGTGLWPVGGITPESLAPWVRAGATGFGIGSQLFRPGLALAEIDRMARAFVAAWAATL